MAKVIRYLKTTNPALCDQGFVEIRAIRYRHAHPIYESGNLDWLPLVALPQHELWVADISYDYPQDGGISDCIGFGHKMALDAVRGEL